MVSVILVLEIPTLVPGDEIGFMATEMISIGKFLLPAMGFIPVLVYLFIRLNMVLSLVVEKRMACPFGQFAHSFF